MNNAQSTSASGDAANANKTSAKKPSLRNKRGCFACGNCKCWKVDLAFVRSTTKKEDGDFDLKQWKCCNKCSRKNKKLSEAEHIRLYGGADHDGDLPIEEAYEEDWVGEIVWN